MGLAWYRDVELTHRAITTVKGQRERNLEDSGLFARISMNFFNAEVNYRLLICRGCRLVNLRQPQDTPKVEEEICRHCDSIVALKNLCVISG